MKAVVLGLAKEPENGPLKSLKETLQKKIDEANAREVPPMSAPREESKQIPASGGVAPDQVNEAESKKNSGNEEYKKKNFAKAIEHYQQAIQINPNEIIYHSNVAAAHIEMKQYDEAILECDKAIEKTKTMGEYDHIKLGKCMARKATAQQAKDDLDNAILTYRDALLEHEKHKKKIAEAS